MLFHYFSLTHFSFHSFFVFLHTNTRTFFPIIIYLNYPSFSFYLPANALHASVASPLHSSSLSFTPLFMTNTPSFFSTVLVSSHEQYAGMQFSNQSSSDHSHAGPLATTMHCCNPLVYVMLSSLYTNHEPNLNYAPLLFNTATPYLQQSPAYTNTTVPPQPLLSYSQTLTPNTTTPSHYSYYTSS